MSVTSLTERLEARRRERETSAPAPETPAERRARLLASCDSQVSQINDLLGRPDPDPDDHVPAA